MEDFDIWERLRRVIEKPGALREVMNVPQRVRAGEMPACSVGRWSMSVYRVEIDTQKRGIPN